MIKFFEIIKKKYRSSINAELKFKINKFRFYFKLKKEKSKIKNQKMRNKILEKKLKQKKKIKVAFFVIEHSAWKLDKLYQLLLKHNRFEPIIIICPYIVYGYERMLEDLKKTKQLFENKKYKFVLTYNESNNEWIDIKEEINPDIIFFTNPYDNLTKKEYYIENYSDTLTCYINYAFNTCSEYEMFYDLLFHNLLWKKFEETLIHLEIAKNYSRIKGKNSILSGYPGLEIFFNKEKINEKKIEKLWKLKKEKKIKKIIWAPHHTLKKDTVLNWSTFEKYADFMLDISIEMSDKVHIIFKPHPILKSKLILMWGKEKTEKYYKKWETGLTTNLVEGEYKELFLTSDGLIHDSGSFSVEYLCTLKPICRLINSENEFLKSLNKFGKIIYDAHYKAFNKKDILIFIDLIVNNNDNMLELRKKIYYDYLENNNEISASEKIIIELEKYLKENS